MSVPPPGAAGTTMRTGFEGYGACESAGLAADRRIAADEMRKEAINGILVGCDRADSVR
jgi:hypothetical protein